MVSFADMQAFTALISYSSSRKQTPLAMEAVACRACMEFVMKGRPAFFARWDRRARGEHKALFA
jgi:hypothetical protein